MGVISLNPVAAYERYLDFNADVRHEDNIAHGGLEKNRLSDTVLSAGAAANYFYQLGQNTGVTLQASVAFDKYRSYKKLDHYTLGLESKFRFKPDLGFTAPWYEVRLRFADQRYPDSVLRDNYRSDIALTVGKRLTDRVLLRAGAGYSKRNTNDKKGLLVPTPNRDPSVFDAENTRVFFAADYRRDKLTFYGKYQYESGDVHSTRTGGAVLSEHYDVWYWDDDIGPNPQDERRWVYRIDGQRQTVDLGLNYALQRSASLDLLLRHVDTRAIGNNDYDNFAAHFGLFYRWK